MLNDDINLLITRLMDGTITTAGFARLKAWTLESNEHRDKARQSIEALCSASALANGQPFDAQAAFSRFEKHASTSGENGLEEEQPQAGGVRHIRIWLRRIAVAAVVAGILWGVYHMGGNAVRNDFADIVTEVPAGAHISLTLPDGTHVTLNSETKFSYSQGFGISDRIVKLKGEGYFTVRHRADLPFVVETGEMIVTDLGTEFLFKNYDTDSCTTIALYAGSARIDSRLGQGGSMTLSPGEQVSMNKLTGEMVKTKAAADGNTARQMSELVFENLPLSNIAKVLSRTYGVNVTVADSVTDKTFYCVFNRQTDTLQDILEDMAKTKNIHYRKTANGYVLY